MGREFLDRPLNILVLGVDAEAEEDGFDWPRSDTMLFIALRPETGKIGIFSIPRDSLVEIPDVGRERINIAYAHGGYALTRQVVEDVMGMPVHRFVIVDFDGLDRKSTRLNSSHVRISYAVFCLKKKTQ